MDQEARPGPRSPRRGPQVERPIWLDRSVSRLIKARSADVLAYVVQASTTPPDLFVAGAF